MNFDPQKFAIGIIDMFAVLLPGAVLVYITEVTPLVLEFVKQGPNPQIHWWAVFAFASYLIGHLIYLAGATLDDRVYETLRKATYLGQIERLKDGKKLSASWMRNLATWLFGKKPDSAVMQALSLKARALAPLSAERSINAFQWSKAFLAKEHPPGFAAVQRFEADSKFFRSFTVALLLLMVFFLFKGHGCIAAACFGLLFLTAWRYADQRFKSTQHAYWQVITLAGLKANAAPAAKHPVEEPTHAGGVVYCAKGKTAAYLLIRPRIIGEKDEWVLPKGHIEPGEEPRATAVREVEEETGRWARVVDVLGDYRLGKIADAPLTRLYLMELIEDAEKKPTNKQVEEMRRIDNQVISLPRDDREQDWFPLSQALKNAFEESGKAIVKADELLHPPYGKGPPPKTPAPQSSRA
jgi:8-oxo-dGTP pyrophosphatase MutT (NUDIX family)